MTMQLNETIKLYLTREQKAIIEKTMWEYIDWVNGLIYFQMNGNSIKKYSSKDVEAHLPSALKNQCIRDAKSIWNTCQKKLKDYHMKPGKKKEPRVPVIKSPHFYVNNQNFKIKTEGSEIFICFPVCMDEKTRRISVKTKMTQRQFKVLSESKLGTMKIVCKNGKISADIPCQVKEPLLNLIGPVMGIDLGILCPAVASFPDGSVKFYGNGRQIKFIRRHFDEKRKELGKAKKDKVIAKINDKESRWMKDIDHKISREIIEDAIKMDVKIIQLEQLSGIRERNKKDRKNNHSLHTWSFYRLQQFIEYKARLAGIKVEYINPENTSKRCPCCGRLNETHGRDYYCKCGFHAHRDVVGAINIRNSTERIGD